MPKTLMIYDAQKRYHLTLEEGKTYELSALETAHLFLSGLKEKLLLHYEKGQVTYRVNEEERPLPIGEAVSGLVFYLMEAGRRWYDPLQKRELLLGQRVGSDLYLADSPCDLLLEKKDARWYLTVLRGSLYLNNIAIGTQTEEFPLELGAELSFDDKLVKVYPDELVLSGDFIVAQDLVEIGQSKYDFYPDYPDYHRSPRIIYRSSEDKVILNAPASEPNKPKDELVKLIVPPLLMLGVTILISIFQPRGLYIIATMSMSVVTMIFSIQGYFKNRKQYKLDLEERKDSYRQYLSDKAIVLNEMARDQKNGQIYHYPSIQSLDAMAQSYSHRIYEKTPLHFDFLYYRLGLGEVPASYQLTYSQQERSGKKDALESEGYALYHQYLTIKDMPVVANLSNGPVGYIGPRPLVLEQLQLMVNQLAMFHSYHDVQLITIMPEEEKEQWDWMRWLPHATLQEMNVRGFVYNQRTRDQVLGSLNQILKMRQNQLDDKSAKEGTLFHPHYVVLVTDEKLILDHVIMEFFTEDPTALGCSLIFVQDVMSSLSENIQTIINIKDRNTGQLVLEEGQLRETNFALDHFPEGYDKEGIARRLAPLNHLQNLKSSIPESVTFIEMYGVETVDDLKVLERWGQNSPYKSLAVPLGLRGPDDIVYLNLHEKAHGPHGLVAGTTGSGKSEIIQSYILSLAVNFHPHDVAFLLIDYKGGGMANLFKDLPHLLGTITNLDGAQSMRALVSINAELKRRQRLFSQYDVNHINQYQKKYKLGDVPEPMPHLFLISDEFAELKTNQPEFMTELVSTARIGRSLGIHLILATQKPSGVVNDQIWSNSRFKLALKVADRQDSQEMLKTPDAADITQAGRAYLQVGNNEVYELFQSAWSGADYQPDKDEQGIEDHTIYAINDLGQYDILNEDLSGLENVEDIRQVPTELDAVVANIQQLTQDMGIEALPQPWLPPLEREIFVQDLRTEGFKDLWGRTSGLTAKIGLVDIPSQQTQEELTHDFEKDGHIALFSSPGMGKSTFLQTITMDLARQYTPAEVHFYLLDFGTNGLLPLRDLPHVADYIMIDEVEKLQKLSRRIMDEVRERKKLFSRYSVANAHMYRRASQQPLSNIILVLDGYDAIKGSPVEIVVDNLLQLIAREGVGLGIYLSMTAARFGIVRANLTANIKRRIVLKLNDDAEPRTIVGRTPLTIEDLPGRGLVLLEEPEVFQVLLPIHGKDEMAIIDHLKEEGQAMRQEWNGPLPMAIPVVPEQLSDEEFIEMKTSQVSINHGILPIGLDFETVEAKGLAIKQLKHLMVMSDKDTAKQAAVRHLLEVTKATTSPENIMLFDLLDEYSDYEGKAVFYRGREADYSQTVKEFQMLVQARKQLSDQSPQFIFIGDVPSFLSVGNVSEVDFKFIFEETAKVGIHLIYIVNKSYMISTSNVQQYLKNNTDTAILAMKMSNQTLFTRSTLEREAEVPIDVVYLHARDAQTRLKISGVTG